MDNDQPRVMPGQAHAQLHSSSREYDPVSAIGPPSLQDFTPNVLNFPTKQYPSVQLSLNKNKVAVSHCRHHSPSYSVDLYFEVVKIVLFFLNY